MKKNFKTKVLYFILGALIFGTIGVSAATYFESNLVTYDNKESGLNSTNVQGAIDELYNACKTPAAGGNGILEKVDIVTSGDGLYEDEYEEGRYFYKGGNPSNYVTFNNEQAGWRIISVEPDKTIKIIRTTNIEEISNDIDEYVTLLNDVCERNNYYFVTLFVTDILKNGSYIIYSDRAEEILKLSFDLKKLKQLTFVDKLVSRKKQMLPQIMDQIGEE